METFSLPARCDRATVQKLVPQLAGIVGPQPVTIDGSQVTLAGQALLQLLLSARRTGQHTGQGVVITPSPTLLEASQVSGLATKLFEGSGYDQ